ncbi:MAG: hypothetical protein AAGI68_02375 [Planctomycetota bacterium]
MPETDATQDDRASADALTTALREGFAEAFRMFREVVERLDESGWIQGESTWVEVPSSAAMHTLVCAAFYIAPSRDDFDWEPGGLRYWEDPPEKLPGPSTTLAAIARVAGEVDDYLLQHGDAGLLQGKAESAGRGQSRVQWMVYALRHLQHHVSQMSAECKRRGLGAAAWE